MPDNRRLLHKRSIDIEVYARDDELWDMVARMSDVKPRDITLDGRSLPAGAPLHDMILTVTIDARMNIVAVQAQTQAAPYSQDCSSFPEVYQALVGLNLLKQFRDTVRERVGGNRGCTHITELAAVLPTVAIQAFAGLAPRPDKKEGVMPPHLDRCRALRLDGPVVARLYPRWYAEKTKGEEQ